MELFDKLDISCLARAWLNWSSTSFSALPPPKTEDSARLDEIYFLALMRCHSHQCQETRVDPGVPKKRQI